MASNLSLSASKNVVTSKIGNYVVCVDSVM